MSNMSRRSFLKATGAGLAMGKPLSVLLGSESGSQTPVGDRKPNIVFVFADQMRSSVLGC